MATKIINTAQKVDSKRFSDNYDTIFGEHKVNCMTVYQTDIDETELIVETYRINPLVNTPETGVRITYIPTNIIVSCSNYRSLYKNKKTAMSDLKFKIKKG